MRDEEALTIASLDCRLSEFRLAQRDMLTRNQLDLIDDLHRFLDECKGLDAEIASLSGSVTGLEADLAEAEEKLAEASEWKDRALKAESELAHGDPVHYLEIISELGARL